MDKPKNQIKKAHDYHGNLSDILKEYKYQKDLTAYLDTITGQFLSQHLINEIVLWKVNRYISIDEGIIEDLYKISEIKTKNHRSADKIIRKLLEIKGVDLPMASTILRFQNPRVFQIIDRHAYRAIYGVKYPFNSSSNKEKKIEKYFDYIDRLHDLCTIKKLHFKTIDRVLYQFDKSENKKLK